MTFAHQRFISLAVFSGALISHPSSSHYFTQPNQSIPVKSRPRKGHNTLRRVGQTYRRNRCLAGIPRAWVYAFRKGWE